MTSLLKKTVHKGSRSIDFISHGLKSSITQPKNVELDHVSVKGNPIKKIKVYDSPIHPFYRPTEISKLIRAIRPHSKVATGPLFMLESQIEGDNKINLSPYFDSSREVIAFFDKIPQDYQRLEPIPVLEIEQSLPADIKLQIETILSQNPDSWDEILKIQMVSEDGSRATNEDKVKYILEKAVSQDSKSIESIKTPLKKYIIQVENTKLASTISQYLFLHIQKYEYIKQDLQHVIEQVDELENFLIQTYPSIQHDPSFLLSLTKNYLHLGKIDSVKPLFNKLVQKGYSPDSESIESYLRIQVDKLIKGKTLSTENNLKQKSEFIESIIDLDDVLYTVMNRKIAKLLLHGTDSLEEASSILQTLQSSPHGEPLVDVFTKLEKRLVNILKQEDMTFISHQLQNALRSTFIQNFEEVTETSNNTRIMLLRRIVKYGSLIYASKLLQRTNVDKDITSKYKGILLKRHYKSQNDDPGYDIKSRDAFLEQINNIEQSFK